MARNVVTPGDNNRMENTSTAARGNTGTIACWIRPNWNSSDGGIHVIFEHFSATTGELTVQSFLDNNVYAGWNGGGHGGTDQRTFFSNTGIFVSGVWQTCIFDWNVTGGQHIYFNNSLAGTGGNPTILTITDTCIGNFAAAAGSAGQFVGSIAEYMEWNVVLTAGERAAYNAGVNPRVIRPSAITLYYPLYGLASPEPEMSGTGKNLTLTGANAANHAPVAPFTRRGALSPRIDVVVADTLFAQACL